MRRCSSSGASSSSRCARPSTSATSTRARTSTLDLKWQQLAGDHDVFGDGTVMILATPGHTPGHQSLMVTLAGQVVILLADATYLLDKMRARRLPAILWNPDEMVASWERLEALEREHDALLIPTHNLDFRAQMKLAPDGWYA